MGEQLGEGTMRFFVYVRKARRHIWAYIYQVRPEGNVNNLKSTSKKNIVRLELPSN